MIDNVKSMYHKQIEIFKLIQEVLEKYNLQPSQLREAVEGHFNRKLNEQKQDPTSSQTSSNLSQSNTGMINMNTNNNLINLNFNLNLS